MRLSNATDDSLSAANMGALVLRIRPAKKGGRNVYMPAVELRAENALQNAALLFRQYGKDSVLVMLQPWRAGTYELMVRAIGFDYMHHSIELRAGRRDTLDIHMRAAHVCLTEISIGP
ncbi:MAG: hypothetical protein ABI852_06530 [Gemmatimonadaceae bacterium]